MHYKFKHYILKTLVLSGLLMCIANNGYTIHQLFLNDITGTFVELEQEEAPENDAEDRTDSFENEAEKDKISSSNWYMDYKGFMKKSMSNQTVFQYFGTIHIELQTPPPEIS